MRIGFVTCVELGRSCIETVIKMGGRFDLLMTLRDEQGRSKSGRVYLDDLAENYSIPLYKVRHINDSESLSILHASSLDWLFIIGWSQIVSTDVLRSARSGVLGIHPTLLPVGRGRASIPWAILKGLEETGVTLFQLDEGVDTGPILAQQRVAISSRETATGLYAKIASAHSRLMANVWPSIVTGKIQAQPQDESLATVWEGRRPEDGAILTSMSVEDVDRLVRAVTRPYPGAFLDLPDGNRLRVWAGTMTSPTQQEAHPIAVANGTFFATQYELETTE